MLQKPANELKYDKLMSYFVAFVAKSDKQFLRLFVFISYHSTNNTKITTLQVYFPKNMLDVAIHLTEAPCTLENI